MKKFVFSPKMNQIGKNEKTYDAKIIHYSCFS